MLLQRLAIDDRSWLYRPFNRSLFLVDGKTGMTAANAEALVERLRSLQHCQTEVRGLRTAPGWSESFTADGPSDRRVRHPTFDVQRFV